MYRWHMVSIYYMSGLHVVTIHVWAFVPLWHRGLYPGIKEVSVKCLQPGGDSLTHISVGCKLPARCFIRAPRRCKSLGPILPTGFVTGYGVMAGTLRTTFPTGPIARPTICKYLDPIRITCLASNLKQITMWSKLSPHGCRCLTLPSAMLQYKPGCQCVTSASKSVSW